MKKKSLALVIMRITLVYAAIIFSLGTSLANNVVAQVALDKEITLNVANNEFSSVLNSIEKLSGVKFIYSSAIIESNRKITLSAKNKSISSVLNEILPQLNLTYEASGNSIIITKANASSKSVAVAQTVTGRVTDAKGETLIGVTVTERGTKNAVTTNTNGDYRIVVANANSTLVFTYVGFTPVEALVGARTVVNVTMNAGENVLNDVVVTALGIKREARKVGTSITSANVDELQQNRTTNVMSSLEGKVAGLNISPPSAGAASSTRIRLRGQSGFNGVNNAPLIVINGLPMDQGANSVFGAQGNSDGGDAFQQVNQDDIENMTILKGATAAALYGSRAGNGAILITTKSGQKNSKFGVEFSSSFAADQILDYTRFQRQYGFGIAGVKPTTVGQAVAGGGQSWGALLDGSPAMFFDGVTRPYSSYADERFKNFYRTGTSFTNQVALSGGNANTSYRMSYSNQDAKGIMPNNDYHKRIFNVGLNSKINDKLNVTFNLNYANEFNNNPPQVALQGAGAPNFLQRMSQSIPLEAFRDGAVNPISGSERVSSSFASTLLNPYYSMPNQFDRRYSDRFLSTTTARYDVFKYLYIQGRVNFDYATTLRENNTPHGVAANTLFQNDTPPNYNGSYGITTNTARNMNYDFLMGTNNQKFGDFTAELTLGGNIRDDRNRNFNEAGNNFVIKDFYTIENTVTKTNVNYGIGRNQTNSLYGVADFGYKSFLYLSVTDRVDWFSVLTFDPAVAPNKMNSYNYPSVSGSFVFSELLPNLSWLNYGKLRASYASVGSSSGINNFQGQLNYGIGANPFIIGSNQYIIGSITTGNNPNLLIKPYGVTEKEIGLEAKTLGNRLNFDVAVYDKRTDNQIINVAQSNSTGYNATPQNLGKLQNRGIEILLDGTPIKTRSFTWTSSFNAAYNESKVLELAPGTDRLLVQDFNGGGNEFLGKLVYQKGYALNQLVAKDYPRDPNGNVLLSSTGRFTSTSLQPDIIFGSADPKWTGGWNNTFRYKKLSLLVHIDYKFGGKVFSSTAINGLRQGYSAASLVGRNGITWPGTVLVGGNYVPNTAVANAQDFYADYRTQQIAAPFVFDGSFIKLRNITVSYDFSDLVKNVKYIKGLTLSASCRNVAILKKSIPDLDPEAFGSSGDSRLGYEQATLPTTRTFGLNLNVKF